MKARCLVQKALTDFLFGLCFGMGFAVAGAVLRFIVSLLAGGAAAVH